MRQKRIKELKAYRQLLISYKRELLNNQLSDDIEKRMPTEKGGKVKVLTLFKQKER